MPITRTLEFHVATNTWPRARPAPAALTAFAPSGRYDANLFFSLIFLALWTRPPVSFGFSLADCWAWFRYIPAIASSRRLKLCDDWTTLDPHHKTILSGDFGVGFTTWALHQALGFTHYSDTTWVVNTLAPGSFALASPTARRGPQKSPDYIAQDAAGNCSVLECKGTQTSRKALQDALGRGIPQKRSLRQIGSTPIQHSLVAGLFIPQWQSAENAVMEIWDPTWNDTRKILSRFPPGTLARGVVQVSTAKELALFDLQQTANALVRVKGARDSVKQAIAEDLSSASVAGRERTNDGIRISREYRWPHPIMWEGTNSFVGIRFSALLPEQQLEALQRIDAPDTEGERQQERQSSQTWTTSESELSGSLTSPMGTEYHLSLLPA
jgi:hypothetical protein